MLINSGIKIYFENSTRSNSALGVTNGVGLYLEGTGEIPAGLNYVNNCFLPKWNGGFSDSFDIRTHVRPQIVSDTKISISNARGLYSDLLSNGFDPEGKRVEFVFYTDDVAGEYYPAPSMSIKAIKETGSTVEFTLSDITTQQHTDISKPINGDTWEPVIIGDHEYGVFMSNGGGFEAINDNRSWSVVVTNALEDDDINNILTGEMILQLVPSPVEGTQAEYSADTFSGMYFNCTDGDGSGKSVKTTADLNLSTNHITLNTINSVYHSDTGNGLFTGTIDSQMGATTSVGTIGIYNTEYISDPNLTSSSSRIFNKDKNPISAESLSLNGSTVSVDAPTIEDGNIKGYPIADFTEISYVNDRNPDFIPFLSPDQAWTYRGVGVWVGSDDRNSVNSPSSVLVTGDIENIIDADSSTSHNVNIHYDGEAGGSGDGDILACQMFYVNSIEDIEVLLADSVLELTSSTDDPEDEFEVAKRMSATMQVHAYWDDDENWATVSNPVEIMSVSSIPPPNTNPVINDFILNFKSVMPEYYGENGVNVEFDVNQMQGASNGQEPYLSYSRGYENFSLNAGAFDATQKKPKGYIVSYSVVYYGTWDNSPAGREINLDIKIKALAGYRKETSVSLDDFVLAEVQGRPYTTFKLYQEHLTKLLNWSLFFKTQPSEGWGLAECTDATYSFLTTNTTPVRSQWTDSSNLNTKKQLEIIQRESRNVMINSSGGKIWNSFIDKLGEASPDYSYEHLDNCEVVKAEPFDEQNIYNTFVIEYDYDIATGSYNSSISITQTSQELYDTSYVTGITDTAVASTIWGKCNVLQGVVGAEKKFPESLSKLRNIYTEQGAIDFLMDHIELYGVNGGMTYNPPYLVTAKHPVDDLFRSTPMQTIGYSKLGLWGGAEATGVILGRKYNPSPKSVEITSLVKPVITVGRIIELETNTDRIIELETNIDRIIELEA